jgi:hypothetical protein
MQQNLTLYNTKENENVKQYLFLIEKIKHFVYKWHQSSDSNELEMYDENNNNQREFFNDFIEAIQNYENILTENKSLKGKFESIVI